MYFISRDYGTGITLTIVTAIKIDTVFHYNLIFSSYIIFEERRNPNQKLATVSLSLIMFQTNRDLHWAELRLQCTLKLERLRGIVELTIPYFSHFSRIKYWKCPK